MSIRNDARKLRERAEEAIRHNPHATPDADLVGEMERVLTEGKGHYISDLHPDLDWRRWPIPAHWTLENIKDLASTIYETAVRFDNAMAPALTKARLTGI